MFLEAIEQETVFSRRSKCGKIHNYVRRSIVYLFMCDNCNRKFLRPKSRVSMKRASNNYYHICDNCDSKKIAQSIGVRQRRILSIPASSLKSIGDL